MPEPIGFCFNKVKVLPIRGEQELFQESQILFQLTSFHSIYYFSFLSSNKLQRLPRFKNLSKLEIL